MGTSYFSMEVRATSAHLGQLLPAVLCQAESELIPEDTMKFERQGRSIESVGTTSAVFLMADLLDALQDFKIFKTAPQLTA